MVDLTEVNFGRNFPYGPIIFVGEAEGKIKQESKKGFVAACIHYDVPKESTFYSSNGRVLRTQIIPSRALIEHLGPQNFLFKYDKGAAIESLVESAIAEDRDISAFYIETGGEPLATLYVPDPETFINLNSRDFGDVDEDDENEYGGCWVNMEDTLHEAIIVYSNFFLSEARVPKEIKAARSRISRMEKELTMTGGGLDIHRIEKIERSRAHLRTLLSKCK